MARWFAEPNGCGGWQVVSREPCGRIVETISETSHARPAYQAAERLNYEPHQWRDFYRPRPFAA
jgi:hypothetical protein